MKASSSINKCKKEFRSRLPKNANNETLVHAIEVFHRYTDQLIRQRLKASPPVTFACQKGCDFCCFSMRVEALPPEVFKIAWHLNSLPLAGKEASWQACIQRLEKHAGYARGKTYRNYHARCPFLGDTGACSIYPVRPRICRTHLSTSKTACEIPGNAQPDPELQQAENDLAFHIIELYKTRGVCVNPAELGQAVLLALKDGDAKSRWLAGEDVFERLPEGITL